MEQFSVQSFLKFEEHYLLFDRYINEWQLWPYVRYDIYTEMMYQFSETLGSVRERRSKATIRKALNVMVNCSIRHPLLVAKKRDILIFSNQVRNFDGQKYECRITDEIVRELGEKAQAAEMILEIELGHMEPVSTEHMLRCDYIDVFPTLLNKLYVKREKDTLERLEEECLAINRLANDYFGFEFDFSNICERVKKIYVRWISRKKSFKRLLKKISPNVLVEVTSYSISRMIMNEVAHELGIKVVELQHGSIAPGHMAYNFAKKRNIKCMPDYLFVFSDFWKNYAQYIQPMDNIIPIGYPYFDKMKQKYMHADSTADELRILVISQHIFTDRLVDDIRQMTETLEQEKIPYHVIYKTHPRESVTSIQDNSIWENKNVELVDDPAANLYEAFSKSDIQIGISSSALFEGLGYGLDTYILHYDTSEEYMEQLYKNGYATLVKDGKELATAIVRNGECKKVDGSYFFKDNALKNATSELIKLLG